MAVNFYLVLVLVVVALVEMCPCIITRSPRAVPCDVFLLLPSEWHPFRRVVEIINKARRAVCIFIDKV